MTSERILALANPLLCAVFAIMFFFLWQRQRETRWTAVVGSAYLANALGFTIFHFAGDPDSVASIVLMHLFYSLTGTMMVAGICLRSGQSIDLRIYATVALVGLGLMIAARYGKDFNARLYAANACYGLMMVLGVQTAARKPEREFLDNAVLVLLALTALQFFVRPVVAVIGEGAMTAGSYRESPFYAVMVIWLALSSLIMAMTLLMAGLTDQMRAQRIDAQRDPLTGLQTRGPFEEDAIAMLERSQRDGTAVSIVVADIDHFKAVNDTFGHQMGDHAIAAFGRVMQRQTRSSDRVGRIGGEEFCIVAWNCNEREAEALADRIRDAMAQVHVNGLPDHLRLTASFGVAERHGSEGYGKLFARADSALYQAKNEGRNCVRVDGKPENLALLIARSRQTAAKT